jgi:hypothetical protein
MLNLATILLPVDFSERSIAAARYAGTLACSFQSQVIMLHVVPRRLSRLVTGGTIASRRLERT